MHLEIFVEKLLFSFVVSFDISGNLLMTEEYSRARNITGSIAKPSEFDSRSVQFECKPDL